MTPINLETEFIPGINYIDQYCERVLDNGWEVSFSITGEAYVIESIGYDYYEENQTTVDMDLDVEIHDVFDGEEMVELTPAQEKEIKQEILKWIE